MVSFIILAIAISFDLVFNGGDGIKNIIHPNKDNPTKLGESKIELIKNIKYELDDLYNDLTLDISDVERESMKAQILSNERIIEKLIQQI